MGRKKGGKAPHMPTAPDVAAVAVRDMEAANLRASGATYPQISQALGVDLESAARMVQRALRKVEAATHEAAKEIVALECWRMDRATAALQGRVLKGNPAAITTLIKVGERRAKLLGLDKPSEVRVTTDPPLSTVAKLLGISEEEAAEIISAGAETSRDE